MTSNSENYQKAYDKALNLIKIRPHLSAEIRKKLTLRGFNAAVAAQVTMDLVGQGLINDEDSARNFLDSLIRFKTYGYYGLKAKLMQRGLASNEAENLLKNGLTLDAEQMIAQKILDKENEPDKNRLMQKLSRKGFRTEVISRVLRDSFPPGA